MLGFIFGLNARLGRLHYFLATIVLAVVMTALCFLVVLSVLPTLPRGAQPTFEMMKWPVIGLGTLFGVISLTLQSMRIRDIGWDPVCVIPGWVAIVIIDMMLARKFPGLSLGAEHHSTAISALVNLGLMLALLFWPSADDESSPPALGEPRRPDPTPRSGTTSVAAERIARASGEFGRRAFR